MCLPMTALTGTSHKKQRSERWTLVRSSIKPHWTYLEQYVTVLQAEQRSVAGDEPQVVQETWDISAYFTPDGSLGVQFRPVSGP